MAAPAERKEQSISMRFSKVDIAIIDRAASLLGCSRADFVREAALRAAENVLRENRPIRMSPEGFADFMAVLCTPDEAVSQMVELAKRAAPWERGHVAKR